MNPEDLFKLFTNPDNSYLFRDIAACTYRNVLKTDDKGYNLIELEQVAEIKILGWRGYFSTFLTVEEEFKELPYTLTFQLAKAGMMKKFSGQWKIHASPDGTGVRATLSQAVLPAGCPPWMTRLPLMGSVLRGISARAVVRLIEDLEAIDAELAQGKSVDQLIDERRSKASSKPPKGILNHSQPTASSPPCAPPAAPSTEGGTGKGFSPALPES